MDGWINYIFKHFLKGRIEVKKHLRTMEYDGTSLENILENFVTRSSWIFLNRTITDDFLQCGGMEIFL